MSACPSGVMAVAWVSEPDPYPHIICRLGNVLMLGLGCVSVFLDNHSTFNWFLLFVNVSAGSLLGLKNRLLLPSPSSPFPAHFSFRDITKTFVSAKPVCGTQILRLTSITDRLSTRNLRKNLRCLIPPCIILLSKIRGTLRLVPWRDVGSMARP